MWNKIKDFLYYISDIILGVVIFIIVIVFFWYEVGGFFVDNLPNNIGSKIPLPVARAKTDDFNSDVSTINIDGNDKKVVDEKSTNENITQNEVANNENVDKNDKEVATETNTENNKPPAESNDGELINNNVSSETSNEMSKPSEKSPTAGEKSEKVTFKIPSGADSTKVADILFSNGIIPNRTEFLNYLENNKIDTKIKAGTYTVNMDTSMVDIAKEITK